MRPLSPDKCPDNSLNRESLMSSDSHVSSNAAAVESSCFALRVKLNDGPTSRDYTLDNVNACDVTVGLLKELILERHFRQEEDHGSHRSNRYLRLIVRGRMMAPDSSTLDMFAITKLDVVHAILAKEGTRGGAQARMLKRLNDHANDNVACVNEDHATNNQTRTMRFPFAQSYLGNNSSDSQTHSFSRLWRRIGIDANGVVISRGDADDDDDDDEEETESSDFEDDNREVVQDGDIEMGNIPTGSRLMSGGHATGRRRLERRRNRRPRERRGFDRLRATGLTRDEVTTIRLYFASSVDQYIEHRRVLIRASRQIRQSLVANSGFTLPNIRQRSDTRESHNSLVDVADDDLVIRGNDNREHESNTDQINNQSHPDGAYYSNTLEAPEEEILLDRLRMEDEWMSTQGPYSEFRMNLNTSNPLLLAAITGNPPNSLDSVSRVGMSGRQGVGSGLFFRRGLATASTAAGGEPNINGLVIPGGALNEAADDDDDLMLGSALGPNTGMPRNPNGFPTYMGPLPSAGSEKDFVWGFLLGFFVGFIMLFWVWMPTVPHKQKIGIISGLSFQLALNVLRKSGQDSITL